MKLKEVKKLVKKGIVLFGRKETKFPKGGVYWKTEQFDKVKLSNITRRNLEKLVELYGFKWNCCVTYKVEQTGYKEVPRGGLFCKVTQSYAKIGKGFIVYGTLSNELVTYIRKETPNASAGQTLLYYGDGVGIQATTLLDFEKTSQFSTGQKRVNQFLDFVKYTKTLSPIPLKLQRIIFEII